MSQVTEGTLFEIVLEDTVDKIAEESIEMIIIGIVGGYNRGRDRSRERDHSQETIVVIELEVQAIADQGWDPEPILIRIG